MDEFRYVGQTATTLEEGRPIAPGEFTGPIDVSEEKPHNKMLLDEGKLLLVPAGEQAASAAQTGGKAGESS